MFNFFRKFSPISKLFFVIVFLIVLAHFSLHEKRLFGMDTSLFYLDEELTFGSLFMLCLTFYAGILTLRLFLQTKQYKYLIWLGIFWFLAIDEYFSIHEYLNDLLKRTLEPDNGIALLASMSWVFTLGFLFMIPAGYILYQTLKEENKRVRILLFLGLFSYVSVLIIEVIGGQTYGEDVYLKFIGIEEGLELVGTIFFIEAFRHKLQRNKTPKVK